jgi:hypothetical protein
MDEPERMLSARSRERKLRGMAFSFEGEDLESRQDCLLERERDRGRRMK